MLSKFGRAGRIYFGLAVLISILSITGAIFVGQQFSAQQSSHIFDLLHGEEHLQLGMDFADMPHGYVATPYCRNDTGGGDCNYESDGISLTFFDGVLTEVRVTGSKLAQMFGGALPTTQKAMEQIEVEDARFSCAVETGSCDDLLDDNPTSQIIDLYWDDRGRVNQLRYRLTPMV